jgi:glycosyltransferase involved in cell wall biosynthesis
MGGAAVVPYDIARQLAYRGHQVTVVTSDFALQAARFPDQPYELVVFPNWIARAGFYVTPGLARWLREHLSNYQVAHLHTVRTFQNILAARRASHDGIPFVLQAHGTLPVFDARQSAKRLYDLLFGRRMLRDASAFIAVSPLEEQQYQAFGILPEKIATIANGLDLDQYSRLPPRGAFRARLGISPAQKVILFLGRLHPIKNLDFLIRVFAGLRNEMPDLTLVLAGPDEGDRERLERLAVSMGVESAVCFPGPLYQADKLAAFVDADVLCYPSAYEIFGLVPFEALMCGTPVVVSKESGMGQIISHAQAGYDVPHADLTAFIETIKMVLLNPDEARPRVAAGQAYIRKYLAWSVIIRQLEALYQALDR